MYLLAYRNLGIFYENAVNKMLRDIVKATQPEWCVVKGEFTPRGGLNTSIFARWPERAPGRGSRKQRNTGRWAGLDLSGRRVDNS
jgi:7-cyano-7-deazaguanine reductase